MTTQANESIPVVDVDQAFPGMVEAPRPPSSAGSGDVTSTVEAALRDVLGWRPRVADPKAFVDALSASFRLTPVEGHVKAEYVPRGYAVQADLGAVTGGQASLYRRATIARAEMLRILEGLVPLRTDADRDDMDAYRSLVRNAVERLVDEIGAAGGPRVQMVDQYFRGLTGQQPATGPVVADTVGGQLGALRDRFGLTDANVNTIEEEGKRTSFWTLVDLIVDLQTSWNVQRVAFGGGAGQGFLGTDLILISRLMEAAADQVDELEAVLDSVLIPRSERRTIMLDRTTSLTVDGLLTWLHGFLSEEGRRIAQDSGRDGIVSFLAPTAVELVRTFKQTLADRVRLTSTGPVQLLPASCCSPLPAGMLAARTRIAVASLCRLLMDLAQTAQRIGRFPRAVLLNVTVKNVLSRADTVEVEFRGINLRPVHIPAFVLAPPPDPAEDCRVETYGADGLLLALTGSSTADDESVSAFFPKGPVYELMAPLLPVGFDPDDGFTVPAEDVATALIDGELGTVVYAPDPRTYPDLQRTGNPLRPVDPHAWGGIATDETIRRAPVGSFGGSRENVDPDAPAPGSAPAPGTSGGGGGCGCGGGSPCGGGRGRGCGCGCAAKQGDTTTDGSQQADLQRRLLALDEEQQEALVQLRLDRQAKVNAYQRQQAILFNESLQHQVEDLAKTDATEKSPECSGDCQDEEHPCLGCGHVWVCGCLTVCGACAHADHRTPHQTHDHDSGGEHGGDDTHVARELAERSRELAGFAQQHALTMVQLASAQATLVKADATIESLQQKRDSARSDARQQTLGEELATAQAGRTDLSAAVERLTERANGLKGRIDEHGARIDELSARLERPGEPPGSAPGGPTVQAAPSTGGNRDATSADEHEEK